MQPEVSELVREHGFDFGSLQPLDQRIEEHDALVATDAGEVGVAVHGASRAVHHEHAFRGESAACEQGLGALLAASRRLSGVNLLNSGAMNVGKAQVMNTVNATQTTHA